MATRRQKLVRLPLLEDTRSLGKESRPSGRLLSAICAVHSASRDRPQGENRAITITFETKDRPNDDGGAIWRRWLLTVLHMFALSCWGL